MPRLRPPHAPIKFPKPIVVGEQLQLDAGAAKSLHFRQIQEKEAFTLMDAEGRFFRASVLSASRERVRVEVYEAMSGSPESHVEITLVAAVLARQRMLMVVQKATELGVTRILPVFSACSVGADGLEHEKAHAWPGQVLRAARQCRRASVPELRSAAPLAAVLDDPVWTGAHARFALDDRAGAPLAELPEREPSAALEIVFAVGPEGGWSDAERALLEARGARRLRLGHRVLRAETAVLAGLAVLQHSLGDLR